MSLLAVTCAMLLVGWKCCRTWMEVDKTLATSKVTDLSQGKAQDDHHSHFCFRLFMVLAAYMIYTNT